MSYYAERNGLAAFWEKQDIGYVFNTYAHQHPEEIDYHLPEFRLFVNKLLESGIDLFNPDHNNDHKYNIEIYVDQVNESSDNMIALTNEEIDLITGHQEPENEEE